MNAKNSKTVASKKSSKSQAKAKAVEPKVKLTAEQVKANKAAYNKAWYERSKKANNCGSCGKPKTSKTVYCDECKTKHKATRLAKAEANPKPAKPAKAPKAKKETKPAAKKVSKKAEKKVNAPATVDTPQRQAKNIARARKTS